MDTRAHIVILNPCVARVTRAQVNIAALVQAITRGAPISAISTMVDTADPSSTFHQVSNLNKNKIILRSEIHDKKTGEILMLC